MSFLNDSRVEDFAPNLNALSAVLNWRSNPNASSVNGCHMAISSPKSSSVWETALLWMRYVKADGNGWVVREGHAVCRVGSRRQVDSDGGDRAMENEASISARFATVNEKITVMNRRLKKIEEWVDGQWIRDN
ncbi:hypothetical protein ACLOJK_037798 [Asimina triloba]